MDIRTPINKPFLYNLEKGNGEDKELELYVSQEIYGADVIFIWVINDITERIEYEKNLKDMAAFPLEDPNPVFRLDLQGKLLFANKAAKDFVNKNGDQLDNMNNSAISGSIIMALKENIVINLVENLQGQYWNITIAPIINRGYVNLYAQNVTAQKKAEEEILKINSELEQKIELRTRQIGETNENLKRFTSIVSHDLRAPLRSILSFLQIYRKNYNPTDDTGNEILDIVMDQAKNLDAQVQSLLKYSRFLNTPLEITEFDISRIFEKSFTLYKAFYKIDTARLHNIQPNILSSDINLITAIIDNLMSNALKYSDTNRAAEIVVEGQIKDGFYEFALSDNGIGFDESEASEIFSFQKRLSGTSDYDGMGIGLSHVKKCIERLGGTINYESKKGVGSTFRFAIPVK